MTSSTRAPLHQQHGTETVVEQARCPVAARGPFDPCREYDTGSQTPSVVGSEVMGIRVGNLGMLQVLAVLRGSILVVVQYSGVMYSGYCRFGVRHCGCWQNIRLWNSSFDTAHAASAHSASRFNAVSSTSASDVCAAYTACTLYCLYFASRTAHTAIDLQKSTTSAVMLAVQIITNPPSTLLQ